MISRQTMRYAWQAPLRKLELDIHQMHIWRVRLDCDEVDACLHARPVISTDEQMRAERLKDPNKRAGFIAARSALRHILSFYTDQAPVDIRFTYSSQGKPHLLQDGITIPIELNISHSHQLAVAALTCLGKVGIDLEFERSVSTRNTIVERYFSANDWLVYRDFPEHQREDSFLTAWTEKEAVGKATGSGLAGHPQMDHFCQSSGLHLPAGCFSLRYQVPFWIMSFAPKVRYTAAAAVMAEQPPEMVFMQFSFLNNQRIANLKKPLRKYYRSVKTIHSLQG